MSSRLPLLLLRPSLVVLLVLVGHARQTTLLVQGFSVAPGSHHVHSARPLRFDVNHGLHLDAAHQSISGHSWGLPKGGRSRTGTSRGLTFSKHLSGLSPPPSSARRQLYEPKRQQQDMLRQQQQHHQRDPQRISQLTFQRSGNTHGGHKASESASPKLDCANSYTYEYGHKPTNTKATPSLPTPLPSSDDDDTATEDDASQVRPTQSRWKRFQSNIVGKGKRIISSFLFGRKEPQAAPPKFGRAFLQTMLTVAVMWHFGTAPAHAASSTSATAGMALLHHHHDWTMPHYVRKRTLTVLLVSVATVFHFTRRSRRGYQVGAPEYHEIESQDGAVTSNMIQSLSNNIQSAVAVDEPELALSFASAKEQAEIDPTVDSYFRSDIAARRDARSRSQQHWDDQQSGYERQFSASDVEAKMNMVVTSDVTAAQQRNAGFTTMDDLHTTSGATSFFEPPQEMIIDPNGIDSRPSAWKAKRIERVRQQPKSPHEELAMQAKYAEIEDVGERAYQILVDLYMI